ncbi:NADH-quinone oxidoreductase subunit J family protein [Fluviicola taffensis]|uniref:NADH-quinone oxidoreductase subunit J n=1 Tax=Fluviicola taffensis (strain DSM 16823 / NCIMB 13979 / RW262) TaxID=755732 RepID=F2IJR3_FLUTR|nr:NADH-quinone oxidoreductase subunit J [Fluviicola taffensis]AEA43953.1 NADH dehydrogenase subunit J [Fluviicola taffensis DSM 16823]
MSLDSIFYILGGLTIGTALMVVLSKHPVRSVLYLVLTFFLISANYVLMNAQFIAIVNIIVYAGAIMVLFLFVLMLLNLNKENEPKHSPMMTIGAAVAGGSLFLVVVAAMRDAILATPMIDANSEKVGLVENLGQILFTKYVLPFEVSSVLFLAAMVGAVLLAKKEKQTID